MLFRSPAPAAAAAAAERALPGKGRSVLLVDNEDSFVHTLADYFRQTGAEVRTYRHGMDAAAIAALAPDLVVHVGDFHYREAGCRPFNKGCEGSPHGDVWPVWEEDFFKPARPLLKAAPFVMVRGNHEECERGGKGWSLALDPYPFVSS